MASPPTSVELSLATLNHPSHVSAPRQASLALFMAQKGVQRCQEVRDLVHQVPVQPIEPPSLDTQYSTIHKSPSRRKSRAMARSVPGTLDRRGNHDMDAMDMDMPLTPASFAGLDHRDLEERPLTSLTNRMGKATVYDEPPEK